MVSNHCVIGRSHLTSTTLLEGATVGDGCTLISCLVGQGATIGHDCRLEGVVVDHGAVVPNNTVQNGGQWPKA